MTEPQAPKQEFYGRLAHNYELMRRGYWTWEDGKPHLDSDHKPRVNKSELLRSVGLDPDVSHGAYAHFSDHRFLEELATEQYRWNVHFYDLVQRLDAHPYDLGRAMLQDLAIRYAACPAAFPTKLLAKIGEDMLKLGIVLKAVPPPPGDPKAKKQAPPMVEGGSVPAHVLEQAVAFLESGEE